MLPDHPEMLAHRDMLSSMRASRGLFADAADRQRLSPACARAMRNIFREWRVPRHQAAAVLGVSLYTLNRIQNDNWRGCFSQDQLTRASLTLGIYGSLHSVFDQVLADQWIGLANSGPLFRGKRPIEFMISEGILGMYSVRRHLESLVQGY
jgi:hypothetical protein